MRKKLDYIYYRFYRFQVSVGNGNNATFASLMFMTFLFMVNCFSVSFILYGIFGIKLPLNNAISNGLTVVSLIFIFNYFIFIHNKRYKSIISLYNSETKDQIKKGNATIIIYLVLSFILMGIGFYLMILRNNGHL